MPYKSRWSIDIPILSLSSYVFDSPKAKLGEKPLIVNAENDSQYLTHHSYREWSKRLAAGLRKAGFQPGDRLLLFSGNTVFFPVVIQGTIMAGGIFTGANPSYVARELAYQLQDSGAKFLITAEASLNTALEAASSIKFPQDKVFVMGDGSELFEERAKPLRGIQHWSKLLASPSEGSKFEWTAFQSHEDMNHTAVINYSSGTTGLPKGVEISHLNYIANIMQTDYVAKLAPDYEESTQRARILSFLPMYHAYGQTYFCVSYGKYWAFSECAVKILADHYSPYDSHKRHTNLRHAQVRLLQNARLHTKISHNELAARTSNRGRVNETARSEELRRFIHRIRILWRRPTRSRNDQQLRANVRQQIST